MINLLSNTIKIYESNRLKTTAFSNVIYIWKHRYNSKIYKIKKNKAILVKYLVSKS